MLTQSEKIDLYFEEAFRYVDLAEFEEIVKNCVWMIDFSGVYHRTQERIKFGKEKSEKN